MVVLAGGVLAAAVLYSTGTELFATNSPTRIFEDCVERVNESEEASPISYTSCPGTDEVVAAQNTPPNTLLVSRREQWEPSSPQPTHLALHLDQREWRRSAPPAILRRGDSSAV